MCPDADEDAGALAECKAWVNNLQAMVMEVDMQAAALRGSISAEGSSASNDWIHLARHTAAQLRDLEQLMQVPYTLSAWQLVSLLAIPLQISPHPGSGSFVSKACSQSS